MRTSEGMFDDDVVYVSAQKSRVRAEGGRITVTPWGEKEVLASFPLEKVRTINVFGSVSVSSSVLTKCRENGMAVNYFTYYGRYEGSFVPVHNTIAEVRRHQYGCTGARALRIARAMIGGKIRNSRTLLSRKHVSPPGRLKELEQNAGGARDMGALRSMEGEAASIYFASLDECLIEGWTFQKRTRRPPQDHINALLSLTYAMVQNEVISALRQYNLDPFLGVMHVDRHGRPALALDLLEEFRPIFCDAFALRLVNQRILTHDDFKEDNHLKDTSFKKYLSQYDSYMKEEFRHPGFKYRVSRRRAIIMQAILLRKAITGEMKIYHPLVFMR
ncbi:type I-D CRISPR-associated endonuclease Cas1 [Methanofollis aquaemaris]|uniref:CRISPR-associated endonuclease Cas1 n=1 Tax=Methanofollis aquaemaris TaxID=126734 RepID=A0A8A3SAG6_9EURY|nr:type I-D CRISPR-associated endonuclease Cas1 [Methanofollis aquaemaris]